MKQQSSIKTLATIVVCCAGLGLGAGLVGAGMTPSDQVAPAAAAVTDPLVGDYAEAQRALDQHLDQRLHLHLARAARLAGN